MRRGLLIALLGTTAVYAAPPGLPADYPVMALTHAKVFVTPDQVLRDATLVIRDGKVSGVGEGLAVPAGARVWDCSGKVVHAGFVELFLGDQEARGELKEDKPSPSGQGDLIDDLRSQGLPQPSSSKLGERPDRADRKVDQELSLDSERLESLRGLGILTVQVVPQAGLLRGMGAVYSLEGPDLSSGLLRSQSCQVIGIRTLDSGAQEGDYPASLMGNLAFIRDSFRSATWAAAQGRGQASWAALQQARLQKLPFYFEGRSWLESLSLQRTLAQVGDLETLWVARPDVCLCPDWIQGKVVLGLSFPKLTLHPARRPGISYQQAAEWRSGPELPGKWQGRPFCLSLHGLSDWKDYPQRLQLVRNCGATDRDLLESLTRRPAQWLGLGQRLGTLEPGKQATLVVRSSDPFAMDGAVEMVFVNGKPHRVGEKHQHQLTPALPRQGSAYPEPSAWAGPGSVLIQGATVWTQARQGCRPACDLLVEGGKIKALGSNLPVPAGVEVIDGRGKHLIPGLIDAHSHTAILGGVNEATQTVSAQVDVRDVLNPFDPSIPTQLAGGVTTVNLLHGSANAIGGGSVTVKWRWGARPEQMIMSEAPPGIKLALGENPKQSNWGDAYKSRYPQTRQGVAALIRQRFQEALKYRQQIQAGQAPQPNRALEVLLEVLDGKRLVHCHSYRQDEILMILQLAQDFHFKVATLQHALEAYKVADEIARAGAGVSTFSDWWAYKLEVMDAIPYNGSLLHERGVVTSFNSDSDELARRLLGEACKAVRYGGLSCTQALDFVTLNPARQLGIERWVGSLEVGKDADMSLWSASPFEPQSLCLATWVDGRQVFEKNRYRREQEHKRKLREEWLKEAMGEIEP